MISYASVLTICITTVVLALIWAGVRSNEAKGK